MKRVPARLGTPSLNTPSPNIVRNNIVLRKTSRKVRLARTNYIRRWSRRVRRQRTQCLPTSAPGAEKLAGRKAHRLGLSLMTRLQGGSLGFVLARLGVALSYIENNFS